MVQAFLSQSTCLLTNNSNCKFTFLFFLCLTYILAQTYEKKHKLHHNHAFNPKSIHNTNFHKKIKMFHCIIIQVKLNCSICFKTSILVIYKQKQQCIYTLTKITKSNVLNYNHYNNKKSTTKVCFYRACPSLSLFLSLCVAEIAYAMSLLLLFFVAFILRLLSILALSVTVEIIKCLVVLKLVNDNATQIEGCFKFCLNSFQLRDFISDLVTECKVIIL